MAGIVEVKREIRRALYAPLQAAVQATQYKDRIWWPGLPFDLAAGKVYFQPGVTWGDVIVREMGPNPRFEGDGSIFVKLAAEPKKGEDATDALGRIVAQAYPYGVPLVFEGVTVHVDKQRPGGYGVYGAWGVSMMFIDWTVYRRD